MAEVQHWGISPGAQVRVGIVSTYPPTRCGIGRFTSSYHDALTSLDPGLEIEVVRLVSERESESGLPVTMQIDPSSPVGIRAAAKHLSRGDVAVINHEFGIYGNDDGTGVLDLVRQLEVPAITVLHTVLPHPSERQRHILKHLCELTTPVVLCNTAQDLLIKRYGVSQSTIEMIRHGARWKAQPVNDPPRRRLITWGLLGPGKGLERSIAAVAELGHLDPPVKYKIVGRTHPNVVRNAGYVYRYSLHRLVEELGVVDHVEFIDRYVNEDELFDLVIRSDLVVAPYDNSDQVSSGVVTEAVALGRPVVATRFPYAEELLGDGAGLVVDHDVSSMAKAIEELLEDPGTYRRAAHKSSLHSEELSWSSVARDHARLIRRQVATRATA